MGRLKDITGAVFGRLTVIGRAEDYVSPKGKRLVCWTCLCSCGKEVVVTRNSLRNGKTGSCGCFAIENLIKRSITHGHTKNGEFSGTYNSYYSMIQRCCKPSCINFNNYGGRGVTICSRWMESFENFLADMGERPAGTTLDRIDVDGNYEPLNCRWTDVSTQAYNQRMRSCNTSGRTGVYFHKRAGRWTARISVNNKEIHLGYFDTFEEAVTARETSELKYFERIKE